MFGTLHVSDIQDIITDIMYHLDIMDICCHRHISKNKVQDMNRLRNSCEVCFNFLTAQPSWNNQIHNIKNGCWVVSESFIAKNMKLGQLM